jgi:hypothetical protein
MTLKVLFAVVNVSLVIVYAFGSGLWVSMGGAVLIAAGGSCGSADSAPGGDCLAGQALGRASARAVHQAWLVVATSLSAGYWALNRG